MDEFPPTIAALEAAIDPSTTATLDMKTLRFLVWELRQRQLEYAEGSARICTSARQRIALSEDMASQSRKHLAESRLSLAQSKALLGGR